MAEQPADQPARAVAPMTSVPAVLSMLLGLLARGVRCALRLVGIGESEAARKCDLDAEALEELRMSTRFSVREIQRVRNEFLRHVADPRGITRAEFLAHPRVAANPLRERVAACFDFPSPPPDPDAPADAASGLVMIMSGIFVPHFVQHFRPKSSKQSSL